MSWVSRTSCTGAQFSAGFYDTACFEGLNRGISLSLSHRLFWPQNAPCLLPSGHLPAIHLHPCLKLQLFQALADPHPPRVLLTGLFSILGIFPFYFCYTEESQHLVSQDKQIWQPQTLSFQRLGRSPTRSCQWPKTLIKRMCNSSTLSMMETTAALTGGQDAHENKPTCVADYNKHMAEMDSTDQMLGL